MEASREAIKSRLQAAAQGAAALRQAAADAEIAVQQLLQELELAPNEAALSRFDEEASAGVSFGGQQVGLVAEWVDDGGWLRAAPLQ